MLHPESPSPARLTRRRVLATGLRAALAVSALGALSGAAVTACGSGTPPEPDPLEAQVQSARADADLAAAAAKAAAPALAPALLVIADQRRRHATALIEELARAAGEPTSSETPAADASASATATAPATPPPTVRDVIAALRRSADSAGALATTLSGYRAGLLGSIAAACTASFTVGVPAKPEKSDKPEQSSAQPTTQSPAPPSTQGAPR